MILSLRRIGLLFALMSTLAEAMATEADSTKNIPWKLHLQSRFSLANGKPLALWGGSVGYVWGPQEHELTLGYQWLGARGTRQLTKIEKADAKLTGNDYYRTSAGFLSVGYWHIVHNSRRWKFGFPIELGFGRAKAERYSLPDTPLNVPVLSAAIVPLQLGGYAEWKATRWLGFGLQVGYRQNLTRFAPIEQFNSPYGRLRVRVYSETYRDWYRFIFKGRRLPSPFFSKNPSQ